MTNLGIVGTGWISNSFAEGCICTDQYRLTAVCSREIERAEAFGKQFGASLFFTDVDEMAANSSVDVVYIASPNAMHYEQCLAVLRARKHVIVEKPAFSNNTQAKTAFELAHKQGVFLFEAIRSIHEENYQIVKREIANLGSIFGASLSFMQRSSRYDRLLSGEEPNVFSLRYSGGALMDIGVYLVYAAIDWFGMPLASQYICKKLCTGVDGSGVILLHYSDFDVILNVNKTCNSWLPSEIRGSEKTLLLDAVQYIRSIELMEHSPSSTQLAKPSTVHWLEDEARCFVNLINGNTSQSYEALRDLALDVHTLITKLRLQAGIVFPADKT